MGLQRFLFAPQRAAQPPRLFPAGARDAAALSLHGMVLRRLAVHRRHAAEFHRLAAHEGAEPDSRRQVPRGQPCADLRLGQSRLQHQHGPVAARRADRRQQSRDLLLPAQHPAARSVRDDHRAPAGRGAEGPLGLGLPPLAALWRNLSLHDGFRHLERPVAKMEQVRGL